MRRYRIWKSSLAMALALTLVMAAPTQASEYISEGTTEEAGISGDADMQNVIQEDLLDEIVAEADSETDPEETGAAVAEISEEEPFVANIMQVDSPTIDLENELEPESGKTEETKETEKETEEPKTPDKVWLHVINGNFTGTYADKEISKQPSVEVTLEEGRVLPENVEGITATRTHGTFDGWYTQSAHEVLQDTHEGYSVWHTEYKNGTEVEPGSPVPEGVDVLYAVFDDSEKIEAKDKLVEYYLDWNGINGRYGHCLTLIRSYDEGKVCFSPEDAAVFSLNYREEFDKQFQVAEDKWEALKTIWEGNQFDGYIFKGWSTEPHGEPIWENTKVTNGMSFYAQWEKNGISSADFELGASLSTSKHASVDASITLTMLCFPIHAQAKDVTWTLSIGNGAFRAPTEVTVTEGNPYCEKGLEARAVGDSLTITNKDGEEHGLTVSVTAKGTDEGSAQIAAPASASVGFVHTWDRGKQEGTPDCTNGATITYSCTTAGCEKTKVEQISPLGHAYENRLEGDKYSKVLKDPTCTEPGERQFICLRCHEVNGTKAVIPALGHDWGDEVETPVSCNQNMLTRTCKRDGCNLREANLIPANNPQLHAWTETDRYHNSCMLDTVYEKCMVCGETRHYTEEADNQDCHAYAFESRVVVDCTQVLYTFKCVYGCGSTQVMLKMEENHVWDDWKTTTAPTTKAPGEQTRTCTRCSEEEKRKLPQLAIGWKNGQTESEDGDTSTDTDVNTSTGTEKETDADANANASADEETETNTVAKMNANVVAKANTNIAPVTSTVKSGWKTVKGKKYYVTKSGAVKTGWQKIGKKKYYFDKKGVMKTGWQKIGGKKYYFGKNGVMRTGWQKIGKKKYYFGKNGVMRTGRQKIGKKKYNFGKNGVLK